MSRKFDAQFEAMKADLEGENKAETVETTTPVEAPAPEPEKAPAPAENKTFAHEPPKEWSRPKDETEPAPDAHENENTEVPPEPEQKPAREIPDDPLKRAEFSFKRQLEKKDKKHAEELRERDEKYEKLLKEVEELKKATAPKEKLKTRDDFTDDEDFMDYKVDVKFNAKMAEFQAEKEKQEAERAEQERQKAEAEQRLREQQDHWYANVDQAFSGDANRSKAFLENVAYANKHGLGEVLDNCPVAADYLINDPYGPLVFEKLLTDQSTFNRVFDPRRPSPLAIYHELRAVEDEIRRAPAPSAEPAPAPAPSVPKMGRPGKQAGGMSVTNNDMWSDPKAIKKWLREHR